MIDNAIVIGAGLFGNTIARALAAEGRVVTIVDDERPFSGSKPSGCLMKPSWFSGLGKAVYDPALTLLDELYGIHDLKFKLPVGSATVHWCNAKELNPAIPVLRATVTSIRGGKITFNERTTDEQSKQAHVVGEMHAGLIVVAAGIWCKHLLPCDLKGKQGASFTWTKSLSAYLPDNRIKPWAPYKQVVAFNVPGDNRIWCGDGSAILPKNWNKERFDKSADRCADFVNLPRSLGTAQVGIRPFSKIKPCLLECVEPGLWLATGGAKNGTVAAGWAAHRIVEATS